MAKTKKKFLKTCPKCKFNECWTEAVECEKCGFNFHLGRVVKTRKVDDSIIDDDILDDIVQTAVQKIEKNNEPQPPKLCLECGHMCYYAAPTCENCKYDFINKQKAKKERTKNDKDEKPAIPEPQAWITARMLAEDHGVKIVCVAPAGKPPIKLKGGSFNEVSEWAISVREEYIYTNRQFLSLTGLGLWIRCQRLDEKTIKQACANLHKVFPNEV